VGHSWVDSIKTYTNNIYTDEEFKVRSAKYTHLPPQSKEALWYREIFEIYYPNTAHTIMKHFWLPKWTSDEITKVDPSARFIDEKK
jgi:asparagine synthase (glutamine-hydrolysing)